MNLIPGPIRQFAQSHPRLTAAAGLFLCFVILFAIYLRLSLTTGKNSDDAAFVLEAQDILRGNILLHGWTLPLDSLYTLVLPLYVIGASFIHDAALLMYVVPAATYAFLVTFCIFVVWKLAAPEYRIVGILIIITAIGCPPLLPGPPYESGGDHVTTDLFLMVSFYLLSTGRFSGAALFLVLADIGDPLAIWVGNLSIMLVGIQLFATGKWRAARVLAFAVGCLVLSKIILKAIDLGGGYKIEAGNLRTAFVALDRLGHNFYLFCESVLALFGANFFGRPVMTASTLLVLIHLAVFAFIAWTIIKLIRTRSPRQQGMLVTLLLAALIVDVAAFIFSASAVDLASLRYLSPVLVYGTLLAALSWYRLAIDHRYIQYLWAVVAFIYVTAFVSNLARPIPPESTAVLDFLESKGLSEGYGGYWSAGILTVQSAGKVVVRQVVPGPGGRLAPYKWLSAEQWYHMENARFVVCNASERGIMFMATIMWGRPQEVKSIDQYRVMIWPAPIHLLPK